TEAQQQAVEFGEPIALRCFRIFHNHHRCSWGSWAVGRHRTLAGHSQSMASANTQDFGTNYLAKFAHRAGSTGHAEEKRTRRVAASFPRRWRQDSPPPNARKTRQIQGELDCRGFSMAGRIKPSAGSVPS